MADVPWPLWPGLPESLPQVADLGDVARLVLAALWRHVDASASATGPSALWEARAAGRRPVVFPSMARLCAVVGRRERAVQNGLSELAAAGLVESMPAVGAWSRVLLDPDGADASRADMHPAPTCTPHEDAPVTVVRGHKHTDGSALAGAPVLRLLPAAGCGGEEREAAEKGAAAETASSPRDGAGRATVRGAAERGGRRWDAPELLAALGRPEVTPPAPACRIHADRPTVARAQGLLAVPLEGLSEDEARAARRERYEAVMATCEAFAEVCRREPDQRRWWCGEMLEVRAPHRAGANPGDAPPTSRWGAVERTVAARAAVAAEAAAAEATAARRRAEEAEERRRVATGRTSEIDRLNEDFQRRLRGATT